LSYVKVEEVIFFVSDIGAEVAANDAVPGRVILLIELLLDVVSDIFFDVEIFEGKVSTIDGVLLHLLVHFCLLGLLLGSRHSLHSQLIKIKSNTHYTHTHTNFCHHLYQPINIPVYPPTVIYISAA